MSTVDELIANQYQPGGAFGPPDAPVERVPMGDVGTFTRGRRFTKSDFSESGIPVIHYGEIYTWYGMSARETVSFVPEELRTQLRFAQQGDVIIAAVGETVEEVGKGVAWLGESAVAIHDDCFMYQSSVLDPEYVSYYLGSLSLIREKGKHVARAKMKRISGENLGRLSIPVPSLDRQRRIVEVLNRYSTRLNELAVALSAEVDARQKQYEQYRQQIIDNVDAEMAPLRSLGRWVGGMTPSKSNPDFWESGTIPWLASMDVSDESTANIRGRVTEKALRQTSLRVVPARSVVVVMRSNILRRRLPIGLVSTKTTVNQDVRALVSGANIDSEYVYQVLRADSERIRDRWVRTDGSMAAVDSKGFFGWTIPLPNLKVQHLIAEKLGRIDALVNDLNSDLLAEIDARRKQYEYYRDRMFAFDGTK